MWKASRVDRAEWAQDRRRRAVRVDGQSIGYLVAANSRDSHPNEFRDGSLGFIWPVGNIGSETPGSDANRLIDAAGKRRRAMQ
jgi:hypothetical protein